MLAIDPVRGLCGAILKGSNRRQKPMMRKLLGLGSVLVAAVAMWGQSVNTGAVLGTISDQSGAVVPHATVTAKNDATGTALTTQADEEGFYRFSFLEPGTYEFEASATGFHSLEKRAPVYLGQTNTVDFRLPVGTAKQSVTVTGDTPLVQEENANLATSFSQSQLRGVPNPGNDLTFVVQASPGAVMDTQQGLGSFSTFGLPATSNVFTVNGMQDNNPFLNLNNAGATNLLLGLGEVQELTVINNAYSGEYGSLAGAQVSVVTKSGTNALHGDAGYWWNGRVLNANDWFNNHTQPRTPKSFDNANQWSAGLGGPIKKDKTFFFLYTEGLRVVIPTSNLVLIPSPQFEAATISNLNSSSPPRVNSAAYYQNVICPLYNNAPGAAAATPSPFNPADPAQNGGCKGSTFAGGLGTNLPCTL
ncbi:MAG TPA: carboxypeptidase-like regulatory domain-containing protein, partial [Terriglobales bacterium]|nr:carboxypeptidase-like regulatory domain-containing protein [Terriglobales bacterium]